MTQSRRQQRLAYVALAASGIIWGTSFIFGKYALRELTVSQMLFYRFLFAMIPFVPMLWRRRIRLNRTEWLMAFAAGLFGVTIQFVIQFEGLSRTSASHAALMIGTAPVLVAVSAWFVLRERAHRSTWLALGLSTLGIALIVLQQSRSSTSDAGATLLGDLLVLGSMFTAVVWIMVSKQLMARHPAIPVTATIMSIGSGLLILWVLVTGGFPPTHLAPLTWVSVISLGLLTTTCTTLLWNWGLSHVSAGKAGVFINLEPVVGAWLGVWLLHDHLGLAAIVGGLLILASAVWVSLA